MTEQSYLVTDSDGHISSYIGPDSTKLFKAKLLYGALHMYVVSGGKIIPTRGYGITRMLKAATEFSGRAYKRSQALQAASDIKVWIATMESALPIEQQGK